MKKSKYEYEIEWYEELIANPSSFYMNPFMIVKDLYFVGNKDSASHLLDTCDGLVLFDTGYPNTIHLLVYSIEQLGFSIKDGIINEGQTAVMEMAESSGIILVNRDKLNPWKATTVGVGQMIRDAIGRGVRDFIVGIGGSATTEGGIGMLSALGYRFLDENGRELPIEFESLGRVCRIDDSCRLKELDECHFEIACDVRNPLCGEMGAVYIFGTQKGVQEAEKESMDQMMRAYADVVAKHTGKDMSCMKGAGAAV